MEIHGVFIVVETLGVLIRGEAGCGKSELALELIRRGHALVADDAPRFRLDDAGRIVGRSPALLRDFLEIRGLGLLNVRRLFGDAAVVAEHRLDFVVTLSTAPAEPPATEQQRLFGCHDEHEILGLTIPGIRLTILPGRNLATLVETSIRNHSLQRNGYNPAQDFQARLRRELAAARRRNGSEQQ